MKRIIFRASIVIALVIIPLIAMAQDDWGPATIQSQSFWDNWCIQDDMNGFHYPAASSNDSVMFFYANCSPSHSGLVCSHFENGAWQEPESVFTEFEQYGPGQLFFTDVSDSILYFDSYYGGGERNIWAFRLLNGRWSDPIDMGLSINTDEDEFSPSLTQDGNRLYFIRNSTIMYSERVNGEFTEPVVVQIQIENNTRMGCRISSNGTKLYLSLMHCVPCPTMIYVSSFDNGIWSAPILLNGNINFDLYHSECGDDPGESTEPTFSPNGKKMYFIHMSPVHFYCWRYYDIFSSSIPTGIEDDNSSIPISLSLSAYPNPFNAQTRIVYVGDISTLRDIAIYSITGQKVKSFAPAAEITWDGADMRGNGVSSGLYFVVAKGINHKAITKVTLLR